LFDRRSASFAAALFAGLSGTQFLGALAAYDAMALCLLASGGWLAVLAAGRGPGARRGQRDLALDRQFAGNAGNRCATSR
jgi:hypothetical protein